MRSKFYEFVQRNGMNLKQLSAATGIPYNRIARISAGYARMSDETRASIAAALGVKPQEVPVAVPVWETAESTNCPVEGVTG